MLVYSLLTHRPIKKLTFSSANVLSFQASPSVVAVVCGAACTLQYIYLTLLTQSTSDPASLQILCARTFSVLHVIPSRCLSLFSRPLPPHGAPNLQNLLGEILYATRQDQPHPVFSLSNRLVAFASKQQATPGNSSTTPIVNSDIPRSNAFQIGSFNVSQADIGNAALKVGGGLLSGMKALGGMAVAAARGENQEMVGSRNGGIRQMFFSKSAPAATGRHERRPSGEPPSQADDEVNALSEMHGTSQSLSTRVTILDLKPLMEHGSAPEVIAEFAGLKEQSIAGLHFSEDGTNLAVTPRDGNLVRIFQIRPQSSVVRVANREALAKKREQTEINASTSGSRNVTLRGKSHGWILSRDEANPGSVAGDDANPSQDSTPWHVYDLRRGRTQGVVESAEIAGDGRWIGYGTRNRTIHLFATNPYGGKADEASHLEGTVRNVGTLVRFFLVAHLLSLTSHCSLATTFHRIEGYYPTPIWRSSSFLRPTRRPTHFHIPPSIVRRDACEPSLRWAILSSPFIGSNVRPIVTTTKDNILVTPTARKAGKLSRHTCL